MKTGYILFFLIISFASCFAQVIPDTLQQVQKGGVIFEKVEVEATFPGGSAGLEKFLLVNMQLIQDTAMQKKIRGIYKIDVAYMIDTVGKVSVFKIDSYPKKAYLESAVINLVGRMPLWTPARQNGRGIRSIRRQQLTFDL